MMSMSFRPIHVAGLPLPPNAPTDGHVKFYPSGALDSESSFRMDGTNAQDVRELMPFGVQVSMQMLSRQHFQEWKKLNGNMDNLGTSDEPEAARDFRLANTRQFDRIIYLGFK